MPRVGGRRHPLLLRDVLHVEFRHREAAHARAAVALLQAFDLDLDRGLDRIELPQPRDLRERFSVERLVGVFVDGDVLGAAAAANLVCDVGAHQLRRGRIAEHALQDVGAIGPRLIRVGARRARRPCRNQDGRSIGAAGRIRILIGPHIDAAIARALDQRHRGRARTPVVLALGLQV